VITTDSRLSILQKKLANQTRHAVSHTQWPVFRFLGGASSGGSNVEQTLFATRFRHYQPHLTAFLAHLLPHVDGGHFSGDVPTCPWPDWSSRMQPGPALSRFESGSSLPPRFGASRSMEAASIFSRSNLGSFYWRRFLRIQSGLFRDFASSALVLKYRCIRQNWPGFHRHIMPGRRKISAADNLASLVDLRGKSTLLVWPVLSLFSCQ